MGKRNIEKFSLGYTALKAVMKQWQNRVHYRKVIVIGKDNINSDDYNIFAPNHQNAVMDALAVIATSAGQPVFLARSDVFRKGLIERILYFLKILPVYRIRDGFDSLSQNDEIFSKTIDVILNKNGLALLPEGEHSRFRRLKILKKGICRIAFQAEESQNFGLGIKIIPVGLEYSHYQDFREVLTVVYGKPLGISEYIDLYKESPQKALNQLRDKITESMKPIMIHIESVDDYEALNELRAIVNWRFVEDRQNPKLFRDKTLIRHMEELQEGDPAKYRELCDKSLEIKKLTEKLKLSYRNIDRPKPGYLAQLLLFCGLLVGSPLFSAGFILNWIFYLVPSLPLSKIKDKMFHSSVRFAISLILAIIFIPLYAVLAFLLIPVWWIALLSFLAIIPAGIFAWNYYLGLKRLREWFRIRRLSANNDSSLLRLENLLNEVKDYFKDKIK